MASMIDVPHSLLVEIDQLVARLEDEYPPQVIFEALKEYLELANDFGYLR